jgi:hypothetical protein
LTFFTLPKSLDRNVEALAAEVLAVETVIAQVLGRIPGGCCVFPDLGNTGRLQQTVFVSVANSIAMNVIAANISWLIFR